MVPVVAITMYIQYLAHAVWLVVIPVSGYYTMVLLAVVLMGR